jgi:pyridoxal biosynthesis lyase PdxS
MQYGAPVGLDVLKEVVAEAPVPVFGIGGIKEGNVAAVMQTGAYGIALISGILGAPDVTAAAQEYSTDRRRHMTRIEQAKKGIVTDEMRKVAAAERIPAEQLAQDIARGVSVIARNTLRNIEPLGIGRACAHQGERKYRNIKKTRFPMMMK